MQLLFFHQWFSDDMLKALSWTLVHSLWQGVLAAALAGIIILSTKRSSARLRYNLLGSLLVLFLFTFVYTLNQQTGRINPAIPVANGLFDEGSKIYTEISDHTDQLTGSSAASVDIFIGFLNRNTGLVMLVWVIFFLANCIKISAGLAGIHRLRTYRTYSADEWQTKLNYLSKNIGIYQSVRLLQSGWVKVPVAVGFFKPVILVPLGLLSNLPADQVETILLHELAHIRRRDYLVNILQRFTEAVFFFNPAILWISSLIRQEREACCDDIVVANTTHKGSYLEALVSFQEYSSGSQYAMGISSKKHYLLNRVKRMLTRENKKLDLMEKILLIIGVIVFSAFTFIPKKEAAAQQPVRSSTKRAEPKAEVILPAALPASTRPAATYKAAAHKETVKAVLPVVTRDTVPPVKEKEQSNFVYEDLDLQSISTSTNSDGKTKTSVTTVVDQAGKAYTVTRLNDKITTLVINGNTIPGNEIGNYSSLLEKIDRAIEKNREKKRKSKEMRQAEFTRKMEEAKRKTEEMRERKGEMKQQAKEDQQKHDTLKDAEHIKMKEKMKEEKTDRKAEKDKRKKDHDKMKKEIEKERKDTKRLFNESHGKSNLFLNGREVIKNENNAEKKDQQMEPGKQAERYTVQKMEFNKQEFQKISIEMKDKLQFVNKKFSLAGNMVFTKNKVVKSGIKKDTDGKIIDEEWPVPPPPKKAPPQPKPAKPAAKDSKMPSSPDTAKKNLKKTSSSYPAFT